MHKSHYSLGIILFFVSPIGNIHMLMTQMAILATQLLHFLSSNETNIENLDVPIFCVTKRLLQDFQPSLTLRWKHELSICKDPRFDP